jgi:hypothetical protein
LPEVLLFPTLLLQPSIFNLIKESLLNDENIPEIIQLLAMAALTISISDGVNNLTIQQFTLKIAQTVDLHFPVGEGVDPTNGGMVILPSQSLITIPASFNETIIHRNPRPEMGYYYRLVCSEFLKQGTHIINLYKAFPLSRAVAMTFVWKNHTLPSLLPLFDLPIPTDSRVLNFTPRGTTTYQLPRSPENYNSYSFEVDNDIPSTFFELPDCSGILSRVCRKYAELVCIASTKYRTITFIDKDRITQEMWARMSVIEESMSVHSLPVEYVHQHPTWFSYDLRLFAYKMRNFLFHYKLALFLNRYEVTFPTQQLLQSHSVDVALKRDDLLLNGSKILYLFRTPVILNFNFLGEAATGRGVTVEFLNSFALELREEIFRFAHPNGYFPSVNVKIYQIKVLACLLARTILAGCTIDIPLNPRFIELMRGPTYGENKDAENERLDELADSNSSTMLADIDPELSSALDEDLTGQPFTLQGREDVQLDENIPSDTLIDPGNIDHYRFLVKSHSCGTIFRKKIRKEFVSAFNEIMLIFDQDLLKRTGGWEGLTTLFSDEEICTLISGERLVFTESDLEEGLIPSGRYTAGSSQIIWLKEIIRKMSIDQKRKLYTFITSERYPPKGGLKMLQPPLKIELLVEDGTPDDLFPKMTVCNHVFKIPQYSSLEIMEQRFLTILGYGVGFGLA